MFSGRIFFGNGLGKDGIFLRENILCPFLFKNYAGHGLIDKTIIIMLAIAHQAGMIAQRAHILQIILHITMFSEKFITEQTVHGKNG